MLSITVKIFGFEKAWKQQQHKWCGWMLTHTQEAKSTASILSKQRATLWATTTHENEIDVRLSVAIRLKAVQAQKRRAWIMRLDTWVHQVSCNVAKNHSTFQRGNYKSVRFRAGRRKKMFHYSIIAMINEMVCNKRSAYESVNNLFLPLKRLVFFFLLTMLCQCWCWMLCSCLCWCYTTRLLFCGSSCWFISIHVISVFTACFLSKR